MGEVDLLTALDRIKSTGIKERTAGLESLREVLSHNRNTSKLDALGDGPFHKIFEALFHFASTDRATYLESTRVYVRQQSEKRLESCASTLRLAVEIGVTRILNNSVSAVLDHIVQTLPVAGEGFCAPLVSGYLKCLRRILEHSAHVEHLPQDLWTKVVNFCVTCLEHTETDSGTKISFSSNSRTASANDRSSNNSSKGPSRLVSKPLLSLGDACEIVVSLRHLTLAPNAPIPNLCGEVLNGVIIFLREKGRLSKSTSAHCDAFATINSVISHIHNDKTGVILDVLQEIIPSIRETWTSKESALNQEILIYLIYSLDYISLLLETHQDFSEVEIEGLIDVLYEEYSRRPERDSLNQLQCSDLVFSHHLPGQDDVCRMGPFGLRTGSSRPEMQWSTLQIMTHLSAGRDYRIQQQTKRLNENGVNHSSKRQQPSPSFHDYLRRTNVPSMQSRLASLQLVVFRISQRTVNGSELHTTMDRLLALASDENSEISNWAIVGLASCAWTGAATRTEFDPVWTIAWQLATRHITSAATCRTACYLAECILRLRLVSRSITTPSLEAIMSGADLYGPAILTDTSSTFFAYVIQVHSSESSALLNVTTERVLQWLQGKWTPCNFSNRAYASDTAQTVNARDVLRILYACTDRVWKENIATDDRVLGRVCQAWLHRQKQQELTFYLLNLDDYVFEEQLSSSLPATCNYCDDFEERTRLPTTSRDITILDFCIAQLAQSTDAMAAYSAKPQDANADMVRLLMNLCLVGTDLSCVDDFQDRRRLDMLVQQIHNLSVTVTGLLGSSNFDERNVGVIIEVIAAYIPTIASIASARVPQTTVKSVCKIAKTLSSSLEDRRQSGKGNGLDDDLDMMDADSGMESQASHPSASADQPSMARTNIAIENDAQSMLFSTEMSIHFFAFLEDIDLSKDHHLPSSFVDHMVSVPLQEFLACKRVIVPALQSDASLDGKDADKLLLRFGTCLESYEYERCEVALNFCFETMTNLTTTWTDPSNKDLFELAFDVYEWSVKKALPGGLLSPNCQIKLADLLIKLIGTNANFGTAENDATIEEIETPSVRTVLFSMLRSGEVLVKGHIVASIPDIFSHFVLSTHEDIFADFHSNLTDDQSWQEGMAIRLLAYALLAARWYTLRRRCVYHIFEVAGLLQQYSRHARACVAKITQALSLKDARELFKLFSAQLSFTWLTKNPIHTIPFNVFGYATLENLVEDNQEELTAQLFMRQRGQEDICSVATLLKTTPDELALKSMGKVCAYCLASDVMDKTNIRGNDIKDVVGGRDALARSINESLPKILGEIFLSMHQESEFGKVFNNRADLRDCLKTWNSIRKISFSDATLSLNQQPCFKGRIVLAAVDHLCERVAMEPLTLWKPPILVYVLRHLFDVITPALGSLHTCSIIRKARVIICLAGDVALKGYPLEMLLRTLRPFLTDYHCADDTLGIVQYLLANGKSDLASRPLFLASTALLILISLRSFLHSPQESTTQESQHLATMNKAQNFHKWFCSYLKGFPVDGLTENLQGPFRAILHAACQIKKSGNAFEDTAESNLLRELLNDQNRSQGLIDKPSRDIALQMLCRDFDLTGSSSQVLFAADKDSAAYAGPILQLCRRLEASRGFLLWSARFLGRAFASLGRIENSKHTHQHISPPMGSRDNSLPMSKTAIVQALIDLFQSDERPHVSYAEKTMRSIQTRFKQSRNASEAVAFEQLLPSHMYEALDYIIQDHSVPLQSTPNWSQSKNSLQRIARNSPEVSTQKWTKEVTVALIHAAVNDAILGALPLVLVQVDDLAERIFPQVLHEVLLLEKGKGERIRHEISALYESWFKQASKNVTASVRVLVQGLLYLRTQPVPAEKTPLARDQWIDIDYLIASRATCECGMYQTALLLAEIATPRETGKSRRSSTVRPAVPNDLLLKIYTNINDPDAIYGVEQEPSLGSVMMRAEHEADGFRSLLYRGARLDSQLRRATKIDRSDQEGVMHALNRLNVNSITQSMIANQQGQGMDESIAESWLETARKLEQWDIRPPDDVESPSGALFTAFQMLNMTNNRSLLFNGLDVSLLKCMDCITDEAASGVVIQSALRSIATLVDVNDVLTSGNLQEIWSTMQSRQRWMILGHYEDVRRLLSCRNTIFSSISKGKQLQNMIPANLRDSRVVEIEALLASSSISRAHGALQDSLSTTTHMINLMGECRENGVEVEAATTMELANVLWDQGEMMSSIKLLKGLQAESQIEDQDIPVSTASLLTQLGQHIAEARLEQPEEVIKSYLNPAVDALKGQVDNKIAGQVYHTFATFCDQQLQNPDGREDFERVKSLREQKQSEVAQLKTLPQRTGPDRRELKRAIEKAQQWYNIDNLEFKRLSAIRNMLLSYSLENYLRALSQSDSYDTDVSRFFALWLENADAAICNDSVERVLADVPSWKFAVLMNQLSSRIQDEDSKFQSLLRSLVLRICTEHPYHGMYHIYAGMKTPGGQDETAISRNAAAKKLGRMFVKSPSKDVWRRIYETNDGFRELACADVKELMKKFGKKVSLRQMPEARKAGEVAAKAGIPPATMTINIRPNSDYGDVPKVVKFDLMMQIASGLSAPKILMAIGTDGQMYKQLYKGGNDELRQDAIMEQVFEEVSSLMRNHRETRRRNLRIRTYKVVPLGTRDNGHAGIIEFVQNSIALHDFLIPAHEKYHPEDIHNDSARKKIAEVGGHSAEQRTQVYRNITQRFNPVMRFFFLERFKDPDEWFERRLAYTRSTAAISILGHVLGLGDRHLHNILLDEHSGEVVHIDLGVAFETGRVLPVPEVVPFRLTRDIVDGMGITGVEGVFRRCCEFMLDALRREQSSIMTILNVLRYDPLYSWSVSPLKAQRMQEAQDGGVGVVGPDGGGNGEGVVGKKQESRRNDAGEADRALSVVQRKLNKTLSTTATVNELIQQATDERNLAVLFQGWSAWV